MERIITILFTVLLICELAFGQGNNISVQTYKYAKKDNISLSLDRYYPSDISKPAPCVIFMFGGGFVGGEKDKDLYKEYFQHLVNKGYSVVSIDYRLGLRGISGTDDIDPMRFVSLLSNSISIAVEDLFDATSYILSHADEWNIDRNQIIASGSSAGAISVLHGEYAISNKAKVIEKLPAGFNYAGIISFAGAIFSTEGDLKWQSSPAPMQLFHGDADSNVPFDKMEVQDLGFYGSKHIAEQLTAMNSSYYFYCVENAAHEISGTPMKANLNEIDAFIEQLVKGKQQLIINTKVTQIGKPEMKKDFQLMDYIHSNFPN